MITSNTKHWSWLNPSGIVIVLLLYLGTAAIYWPVKYHGFVYDDHEYVTANRHVRQGLTPDTVIRAFSERFGANWHPLTLLSHALDCRIFGLDAGSHHLVNVALHGTNAALLFLLFFVMTGRLRPSACVAALFAFHPLHVESVAWIAERKDVLSTFFWILTSLLYTWYAAKKGAAAYLALMGCFALGLLAKPMLVTLPFTLLLLDVWPLRRVSLGQAKALRHLVLEKIPLFALSATSSIITYWVQKSGGAMQEIPLGMRIGNAVVSYGAYLLDTIRPGDLAVLYPFPRTIPWWHVVSALALIIGVFYWVFNQLDKRPYLAVGWLWYLGTLAPVIGLVQVGFQARADRYTYVPLIGIFIMAAWGLSDLTRTWRKQTLCLTLGAGLCLPVLMGLTALHLRHWKDNRSLFTRALAVTRNNYIAHANLGAVLAAEGAYAKAAGHLMEAVRINPLYAMAHVNLGVVLKKQGRPAQALTHYETALGIEPENPWAHNNLANALMDLERPQEAVIHYEKAVRVDPYFLAARLNLARALEKEGRLGRAVTQVREVIGLKTGDGAAYFLLGRLLNKLGRQEASIASYQAGLDINPRDAQAHNELGVILIRKGDMEAAAGHFSMAVHVAPDQEKAHNNLGVVLAKQGRFQEAITHFQEALGRNPDFEAAKKNLAAARVLQNDAKTDESVPGP